MTRVPSGHAMYEILGLLGQIIVHDVRDMRHVDAERGHVGRHQHAARAFGKALQRRYPMRLRAVAVDARRRVALMAEPLSQPVGGYAWCRWRPGSCPAVCSAGAP